MAPSAGWNPASQRKPVPGCLTPAFGPDPVRVAVPPALLPGPVQACLDCLDFARVLLGVQRRRADRGARILLQPLHLAAETLVHHEPGTAVSSPWVPSVMEFGGAWRRRVPSSTWMRRGPGPCRSRPR